LIPFLQQTFDHEVCIVLASEALSRAINAMSLKVISTLWRNILSLVTNDKLTRYIQK